MILPPRSPTLKYFPYLSKEMLYNKSYLVILEGSGSPSVVIAAIFNGLVLSWSDPDYFITTSLLIIDTPICFSK